MTNPSRVRSNGRDARAGSSLCALVARMVSKQAIEIGEIGASAAPVITTEASPSVINWLAYPMASIPEVHPVDTTMAGPLARERAAISVGRLVREKERCRKALAYPG